MIRVIGHRIAVKRQEQAEKTESGLIIPEVAKARNTVGEVVGLGTGKYCKNGVVVEHDVKIGDIVLYGKFKGSDVEADGTEYLIIEEDEILGVYE